MITKELVLSNLHAGVDLFSSLSKENTQNADSAKSANLKEYFRGKSTAYIVAAEYLERQLNTMSLLS